MMNTGGSGSLKVNQKRSIYVRYLLSDFPVTIIHIVTDGEVTIENYFPEVGRYW